MRRKGNPRVRKFYTRRYRLWGYDVWGNAREGYEVNDRYDHGMVLIRVAPRIYNAGTPHEFTTWEPTNRQLSRFISGASWEGESDYTLYAESARTRKPLGELDFDGWEGPEPPKGPR